jgi:hypothetical protein
MILGISYEDARERLFGRRRPKTYAVDWTEINKALRAAGFGTRLARALRGRYPRVVGLEWSVRVDGLTGGHFVVWDPEQPDVFLDPDPHCSLVPVQEFLPAVKRCREPHLVVKVG